MTNRMKLKGPSKKKKKFKAKYFVYMVIIYVSFAYSFYNFMRNNESISNEEFINMLVKSGNANILGEYKTINVVNKTMNFLLDIDFTNPNSIMNASIFKFGNKEEKIQVISIEYNDDYSDMDELKDVSDYINDPNPGKINSPLIYLYNSHQLENYSNSNLDIYGITPNVLMASYLLREKLNGLGIETIVEEANMSDVLNMNGWDYSYSYVASRTFLQNKMKEYPSLKYFIDLHRDSVSKNMTTVTINGEDYAKVLFVVGQDYNTWEENYKVANDINSLINKHYNGLSRGIITKGGNNVNGVYNQDLNSRVVLIELGGAYNTIEEVNNTVNALAEVLYKYIKG